MVSLAPIFDPPVIAHRGVRSVAPENTIAAFKRVRESGARWFETDVKLSRDGVPLLFHDDEVSRTTDGQGAVAEMDWEQLHDLDAGSWFDPAFKSERVPKLSDGLRVAFDQNLRINIEIKPCPGRSLATSMVAMIEIAKMWTDRHAQPLISSFDIDALITSSRMHPEWPRGLLLEDWRDDWQDIAERVDAATVHFDEEHLTEDRLATLRQSTRPILAYTVNDPKRAIHLINAGIKAVFSDNPAVVIDALRAKAG
jgi:glycerophosphoryl diester phosphodiesterase